MNGFLGLCYLGLGLLLGLILFICDMADLVLATLLISIPGRLGLVIVSSLAALAETLVYWEDICD